MTLRGRRGVQVGILAFAALLAVVFGVVAVDASAQVVAATDAQVRRQLLLAASGAWLKVVGIVGLYGSQAAMFKDWPTFVLPFAPAFGRLGGRRGLRRARRQIDGEEPYGADEVDRLRSIARFRVDLLQTSTGRASRAGSVALALFFLGTLLQPLQSLGLGSVDRVLGRAVQVIAVVMIVVLLVSLVWLRSRTDEKARAFLARTGDAPLADHG